MAVSIGIYSSRTRMSQWRFRNEPILTDMCEFFSLYYVLSVVCGSYATMCFLEPAGVCFSQGQ